MAGSAIQPSPNPTKTRANRPAHAGIILVGEGARPAGQEDHHGYDEFRIDRSEERDVISQLIDDRLPFQTIREYPNGKTVFGQDAVRTAPSMAMTFARPTRPALAAA